MSDHLAHDDWTRLLTAIQARARDTRTLPGVQDRRSGMTR
jgi:hypothetical protein